MFVCVLCVVLCVVCVLFALCMSIFSLLHFSTSRPGYPDSAQLLPQQRLPHESSHVH